MAEKKVEEPTSYKVVVVGGIASGKQCLVRRYVYDEYHLNFRHVISFQLPRRI